MSKVRRNRALRQFNRVLIAVLSLVGMLPDGLQSSDLVLQAAVLLWLWSAELQVVEAACLDRLRQLARQPRHDDPDEHRAG